MASLTRAHQELFRRRPDECFESLESLYEHCAREREESRDVWQAPRDISASLGGDDVMLQVGVHGDYRLNDWSFGQLCRLSGVAKETLNRLSPRTAQQVLSETLPTGSKPMQFFTSNSRVRSLHGVSYTRLHNADLLGELRRFGGDFEPPPRAYNGATGLYAGEQDMFCFLMDPTGWVEIDGESFAPGFFVWNSEVGRRSFGVQTFWLQAVCRNHIVWDAIEVVEFTRKHTAKIRDGLTHMTELIETLVKRRDARRDAFASAIRGAMRTTIGDRDDEVIAKLAEHGIGRTVAREAYRMAAERGMVSLFSIVDALTRLSGVLRNAGERTEADQKAGALLSLAV